MIDESRLREDLDDAAVPDADDSERRAWELVAAAYGDRAAETLAASKAWRPLRVVLASAIAVLAAAALALTPAGAAVTDWIGDAIDPGRDDAKPALTRLPAPGDLLVTSDAGAWVVHADGSKRLLGDYDEATWSPRGMFVAVAEGRELSAVDPLGTPRWSIARRRISDPRWSPNEGYRVAYRSGDELRVIWGDGTNDRALGPSAAVAPDWKPRAGRRNVLAYVDPGGRVRIVDADTGQRLGASSRFDAPVEVEWSDDGRRLLLLTSDSLRILDPEGTVLSRIAFAANVEGVAAEFRPGSDEVATIRRADGLTDRSEVVLTQGGGREHRLFSGSGRFQGIAYSPDGSRLLVGWSDADQWLFLPSGRGRVETVGNVARQFDSGRAGDPGAFPRVAGWCCRNR